MRIVFRLVLASLLTLYRKVPDLVFLSLRLVLGVATPSERSRLREVALRVVPGIAILLLFLGQRVDLFAQNPWEDGVEVLCDAFFGVIGKGLAIIAVVIGGLMFAFGEGGSKSAIAGLVFGAGMVLGAAQFLEWLELTDDTIACG